MNDDLKLTKRDAAYFDCGSQRSEPDNDFHGWLRAGVWTW